MKPNLKSPIWFVTGAALAVLFIFVAALGFAKHAAAAPADPVAPAASAPSARIVIQVSDAVATLQTDSSGHHIVLTKVQRDCPAGQLFTFIADASGRITDTACYAVTPMGLVQIFYEGKLLMGVSLDLFQGAHQNTKGGAL